MVMPVAAINARYVDFFGTERLAVCGRGFLARGARAGPTSGDGSFQNDFASRNRP